MEDDKVDRMAFERMVKTERLPYEYNLCLVPEGGQGGPEMWCFDVMVTDYNLGDGSGFDLFPEAISSGIPSRAGDRRGR